MAPRKHRSLALVAAAATAAGTAAVALPTPVAAAAALPAYGTTWVVDHGDDAVTAYAPTASGNVAPIAQIKGSATGLSNPMSVAVDNAGEVYVTNSGNDSVTKYAVGASGNAAPIATISGSSTGLNGPTGIAIAGTDVWVSNQNSDVIERFSTSSQGDALPYASIYGPTTRLDTPTAVSLGPNGDTLWVVNNPLGGSPGISEFVAGASGDVAPVTRISGSATKLSNPSSVAVDGADDPWVANAGSDAVTTYSRGGNHAPAETLSGSKTGLDQPAAITLDAIGRVTVANLGDASVRAFGKRASGNAAPARVITGSNTGLAAPTSVAEFATLPGAPRGVHAHVGDGRIRLTWNRPGATGGGILGYAVVVANAKPGQTTQFPHIALATAGTSYTRSHLKNGHRYYFTVLAVNGRGVGTPSASVSARPGTTPGPVRKLTVSAAANSLTVGWKPPKHDGGRAITGYRVRYATCRVGAKACSAPTLHLGAKATSVTLHDVAAGHRYNVRIVPHNHLGYGKAVTVVGTPR